MKHVSIVRYEQEDELEALVNQWIQEHEEEILEIIDISYEQYGDLFTAVLTYEERKWFMKVIHMIVWIEFNNK